MTNIAMENNPFIDGLPIKNGGSFMAMLVYQRVIIIYYHMKMFICIPWKYPMIKS